MEYQNERGWEYHQKMSSMLQLGQFLVMCRVFFKQCRRTACNILERVKALKDKVHDQTAKRIQVSRTRKEQGNSEGSEPKLHPIRHQTLGRPK
jgi:hypothetical protein